MKDMKFRVNNEQHSKAIQECLFKLGFVWNGCRSKTIKNTSLPYLFAYSEELVLTFSPHEHGYINSEFKETTLEELKQMLNQTERKPHVHCELIKAWADGAEIQILRQGEWHDCNNRPHWFPGDQYRIKPETNDVEKYGIEVGDVWYVPYFKKSHTVCNIEINNGYVGGKLIKTLDKTKIGYDMFIKDKCKLIFRRGVVNLL